MLNYKTDRLDYGKLLNPPLGFKLDMAVATTYSLDLYTLLSIPIALFYASSMGGQANENRMDILSAIQKTGDSLKVYCQRGKIAKPKNINKLTAFLEDSIYEVLPDKPKKSFHPKIWVIRYLGPDSEVLYRIIVMSRNLSLDRSYDLAFYVEGYKTQRKQNKNKPLVDYLEYLTKFSDFKNSPQFIHDLSKTKFSVDLPYQDISFYPMGFKNYKNPLTFKSFNELLIISPFLDTTSLKRFAKNVHGKKYLFSRKEELDKIPTDLLEKYESYMFSNRIVDGEEDPDLQEEGFDDILSQNLHAKLFIGANEKEDTEWYLGSANCTSPAFDRNEEFMVGLSATDQRMGIQSTKKTLLLEMDGLNIFERYERQSKGEIENEEGYDFRDVEHQLLKFLDDANNFKAKCILQKDRSYKITFLVGKSSIFSRDDIDFYFAPFGCKESLCHIKGNRKRTFTFEGIPLINLSQFVIWRVVYTHTEEEKEFLLKADINLPEGRKQSIFRSILESQDKFLQYIQFLLGESQQYSELKEKNKGNNGVTSDHHRSKHEVPLLEELMIAASREPQKLKEIDATIKMLSSNESDDLVPEDFKTIWQVFKKMI